LNAVLIEGVPRDHGVAKQLALARDNYRSISGQVDASAVDQSGTITATNAAHIIPFSVQSNLDKKDKLD